MKRRWLWLTPLILVAIITVAAISAWWWLTGTRGGAEWLLERAAGAEPSLRWQNLEGSLSGGIRLENVRAAPAGISLAAARLELAARVRLLPAPRVTIDWLRVHDATIALPDEDPEAAPAGPMELPGIEMPVTVVVRELRIEPLDIRSGQDTTTMIDRIRAAGRIDRRLDLEHLTVEMGPTSLTARGSAGLDRPWPVDLEAEAEHAFPDGRRQRLALELDGTAAELAARLQATGWLAGQARADITGLPGTPRISAALTAPAAGWPDIPGRLENLDIALEGTADDWQITGTFTAAHPDYPPADLSLAMAGSDRTLRAESLTVDWLGGRIEAAGEVSPGTDWRASASLRVHGLHLNRLYPDVPVDAPLNGRVDLAHDAGRIDFSGLEILAPPLPLEVRGDGSVDLAGDRVNARLEWREFSWPPGADADLALVTSDHGSLAVEGRLSDWRARLDAVLATTGLDTVRVHLDTTGDRQAADVGALEITGPAGTLSGRGRLAWAPHPAGRLELTVRDLNPGLLDTRLTGDLHGQLGVTAVTTESGSLHAEVDIPGLGGTWLGRPVHAAGTLSLDDGRPGDTDLELAVGDNRLSVASRDGRAWVYELAAEQLAQLWPGAGGALNLSGRIVPAANTLTMNGSGASLSWGEYQAREMSIEADWRLDPSPGRVNTRLALHGLAVKPWERYETVTLAIDGSCLAHAVTLDADGGRGRLILEGDSRLAACPPAFTDWALDMNTLAVTDTDAGEWRLAEAGRITYRAEAGLSSDTLCLVPGDRGSGRLCVRGRDIRGTSGEAVLNLRDLPVDVLLLPVNPGFSLDSALTGEVDLAWRPGGLVRADGLITATAGHWQQAGTDRPGLGINGASLSFGLVEASTLHADLEVGLEGDTKMTGEATLAGVRDLSTAELDSELHLAVPDLAVFTRLTPEIDRLGGRLEGRLRTTGGLNALSTGGELNLTGGEVVHAPYGMAFTEIEMSARSGPGGMRLEGEFSAGEGRGRLTGSLEGSGENRSIAVALAGDRLSVFDIDWLQLTASPDLNLRLSGRRISLDGRLDIPRARIGLPPGTENRVSASRDVVLAGEGEQDDDTGQGLELDGAVTLALGEDVRFQSQGLKTDLAGEVRLGWNNAGPVPDGDGLIRLRDGTYQAYGQTLEIRTGEIAFNDQPVDNPRLDIRAVREIFGDPGVKAAGVAITGHAQQPDIDLFTDPPTSREKALAYIATGSDFDHAAGVGAFNLGFYLLPDLFVSYGIGLFETGNVLSARYELSRRWGVRAQSGERDTGVDFSYVINR